jgi:hypothetical protein
MFLIPPIKNLHISLKSQKHCKNQNVIYILNKHVKSNINYSYFLIFLMLILPTIKLIINIHLNHNYLNNPILLNIILFIYFHKSYGQKNLFIQLQFHFLLISL